MGDRVDEPSAGRGNDDPTRPGCAFCGLSVVLFGLVVGAIPVVVVLRSGLLSSPDPSSDSGARLEPLGDLDGDGVEDVVATTFALDGAWETLGVPNRRSARYDLRVHSGRTGEILFRRSGSGLAEACLGSAGIGDVDGDGTNDVALAGLRLDGRKDERFVVARSGSDWSELWRASLGSWGLFSQPVPDFVAVDRRGESPLVVLVADGRGEALAARTGVRVDPPRSVDDLEPRGDADNGIVFERDGRDVGDVDGDGIEDVLETVGYCGEGDDVDATVRSGATGEVLTETSFARPMLIPGRAVALGDVDGDGARDWAIALSDVEWSDGLVSLVSGRTGAPLGEVRTADGRASGALLVTTLDDFSGDGARELVLFASEQVAAYSGLERLW